MNWNERRFRWVCVCADEKPFEILGAAIIRFDCNWLGFEYKSGSSGDMATGCNDDGDGGISGTRNERRVLLI